MATKLVAQTSLAESGTGAGRLLCSPGRRHSDRLRSRTFAESDTDTSNGLVRQHRNRRDRCAGDSPVPMWRHGWFKLGSPSGMQVTHGRPVSGRLMNACPRCGQAPWKRPARAHSLLEQQEETMKRSYKGPSGHSLRSKPPVRSQVPERTDRTGQQQKPSPKSARSGAAAACMTRSSTPTRD